MIYKLLTQLSTNEFHLRRVSPYNIDSVLKTKHNLTINDKKEFCIFLDVLKCLIFDKEILFVNHQLSVFGVFYSNLDENELIQILENNISKKDHFLNFTLCRSNFKKTLRSNIQQLDESKLTKIFEDAE